MISSDLLRKEELKNHKGIFWWYAPKGYYFSDQYGTNYGTVIVGGDRLSRSYILREYEEDKQDNPTL